MLSRTKVLRGSADLPNMQGRHRVSMDLFADERLLERGRADGGTAALEARGFKARSRKATGAEPVRAERVLALRLALSHSFYEVSASRLADCLMARMLRRS